MLRFTLGRFLLSLTVAYLACPLLPVSAEDGSSAYSPTRLEWAEVYLKSSCAYLYPQQVKPGFKRLPPNTLKVTIYGGRDGLIQRMIEDTKKCMEVVKSREQWNWLVLEFQDLQ